MSCKCNNKVNTQIDICTVEPEPYESAAYLLAVDDDCNPIRIELPADPDPPVLDFLPLSGGTMTGTIYSRSIIPTSDADYDFGAADSRIGSIYCYSQYVNDIIAFTNDPNNSIWMTTFNGQEGLYFTIKTNYGSSIENGYLYINNNRVVTINEILNIVQYDEEGNIELREKTKILGTNENNVQYEILGLNEYNINGDIYDKVEVGSESLHLNLNTNNDPNFGEYITIDTPSGKQINATFNEGILKLDSKYFTPVGGDSLSLQGITVEEIQDLYRKYQNGLTVLGTNKNGFVNVSVERFNVNDNTITFIYNFAIADYNNNVVNIYQALISAVIGSNIATPVQLIHSYILPSGEINTSNGNVVGSLTSTSSGIVELPIDDTRIYFRLRYSSSTLCNLYVLSPSGVQIADIRRSSIYGDGVAQGKSFDTFEVNSTEEFVDDILSNTNDTVEIMLGWNDRVYVIKIFISGSGDRIRMWYERKI